MSKIKNTNNSNNAKQFDDNDLVRKDLYSWKKTTTTKPLNSSSTHSSLSNRTASSPLLSNRSANNSILLKPINVLKKEKKQENMKRDKYLKANQRMRNKQNDLNENDNGDFDEVLDKYEHIYERDFDEERPDLEKMLNPKKPQNVESLDLSDYNLNEMININKFLNLKSLDLSCNQIKNIEKLNLKSLNELKLYANQIDTVHNLENLSQLYELQLQTNHIKSLGKSLCELKNLQILRLDSNLIESIQDHEIAACDQLVHLNISENKISSLKFLNCLPNIEELIGNHLCIERIDFDILKCKKLTELDLSNNTLTDDTLEPLEGLKHLLILNLSSNLLKFVTNIAKIKGLRNLNVSSNLIKKIYELKNLPSLESLDVSNNQIEEWSQIEPLNQCTNLIELEIHNNPIMIIKTVDEVRSVLKNLQYINSVPLNGTSSVLGTTRLEREIESSLAIKNEFVKFESDMNKMNDKFVKKFQEITDKLHDMEKKYNLNGIKENSDIVVEEVEESKETVPNLQLNPVRLASASASFDRLSRALSFSKLYE